MSSPPARRTSKRLVGLSSGVVYPRSAGDFDPTVTPTKHPSPPAQPPPATPQDTVPKSRRVLALVCSVGLAAVLWASVGRYLTFEYLGDNQAAVQEWVRTHQWLSVGLYIGVMSVVIGLTCPGATFLSFLGGFLFPQPYAALAAYLGYNLGANLSFLTARFVLRDIVRGRLEKQQLWHRFENSVKTNSFMYIAVARFTLIFPFWFVNMASAVAGVRWASYAQATALSTLSGSVVYTCAGRALGNGLLKAHEGHQIDTNVLVYQAINDPNVIGCLVGLLGCGAIVMSIGSKYRI